VWRIFVYGREIDREVVSGKKRIFSGWLRDCGAGALAGPPRLCWLVKLSLRPTSAFTPSSRLTPKRCSSDDRCRVEDDSEAKQSAGLAFANQIITLREHTGIPLSYKLAIKPNLTATSGTGITNAIVTDPYVVEGFVEE